MNSKKTKSKNHAEELLKNLDTQSKALRKILKRLSKNYPKKQNS